MIEVLEIGKSAINSLRHEAQEKERAEIEAKAAANKKPQKRVK